MSGQQNKTALPRRIRNTLYFRSATVLSKTLITRKFWRIELSGDALKGFISPGFDDHIKVFFPAGATGEIVIPEVTEDGVIWPEGPRSPARDYTPLTFNSDQGRLTIDFFRHPHGVAAQWADNALPGDKLAIGGPRGSLLVPREYGCQLYFSDETGLPALKRRMMSGTLGHVALYLWCDADVAQEYLGLRPEQEVHFLEPGNMNLVSATSLCRFLDKQKLPAEDYFIWISGEGESVKVLSDYFISTRQCAEARVRAVAYWHQKG